MRVQVINPLYTGKLNNQNQAKTADYSTNSMQRPSHPLFAYKDYNISFVARLNRTPEDFYAQKFNIDNMPVTVKKYLFEDFEQRQHMPPAQLQRQAFEYLKLADSVQDIKDMYPDEPLFAHLKELKDVKPNTGILLLLKWDAQTSQTPVFKDKNNKDLTTYLLKKVYLEGKTIEELNNDFDNDVTDEIKRELGVKDKKYFSHSNIYTLGIRYPKLPYYNSFLATRNDKEYIPPVRKSGVTVSEETREKLSSAMTKWWAGLNETERSEQIQKMLNGKEMSDSIFSKYQGQIMTIAAAQMEFSEKLSDIFAEKYSDEDFAVDFPTFSEQQREIMLEFWNKDPEFRTKYSQALQDTISEFENAYYSEDKTQLEQLLNKALDLKAKVLNKAQEKQRVRREMQKLAQTTKPPQQNTSPVSDDKSINLDSSNTVNKLFRKYEMNAMKLFTDSFKMAFIDFLMRNTNQQTRKEIVAFCQPEPQKLLNVDDEEFNAIANKLADAKEELNDCFNRTYILTAKTNDFVLNKLLYNLTGEPQIFMFERGDIMDYIEERGLEQKVLELHNSLNAEMKKLAVTSPSKELDAFAKTDFNTELISHIKNGFKYYYEVSLELQQTAYALDLENQKPDAYKEFLKNYNAVIKYYNNPKTDKIAKVVIMEHLIVDYINWLSKKEKRVGPKPDAPQDEMLNELDKNYDIDLNSEYSLKRGLQQYLHKNETKYWVPQAEKKFLELVPKQDYLTNEALQIFFAINFEKYRPILKNLNSREQKNARIIENTMQLMLHKGFEKAEPLMANANHAALNYVLYDITGNPEVLAQNPVDTAKFIKNKYLDKKVSNSKDIIMQKYEQYIEPLSSEEIHEFYDSAFRPMMLDIFEAGVEYENIDNAENFERVQKLILGALNAKDSVMEERLTQYLADRSAFIKLMQEDTVSDDGKDRLAEMLVVDFERRVAQDSDLKF